MESPGDFGTSSNPGRQSPGLAPPKTIGLPLSTLPTYEVGAVLLAVLAWPEHLDDETAMANRHAAICQLYVQTLVERDPDWACTGSIKPIYGTRHGPTAVGYGRELDRALRRRMVAARIAIAFLQEAEGCDVRLPPSVRSLSVTALCAMVAEDAGIEDPANVATKIWRPSLPVVHIATAVAVSINLTEQAATGFCHSDAGSDNGKLSWSDFLASPDLIREVAETSELHADLALKSKRLPNLRSKLVRLKIS